MDLVSLPTDVFLLILSYLSPKDHVRCFRVDKRWHKAFADDECCRRSLLQHYPRAREVRARLQPGLSSRATSSPHEYCDFLAAQSWRNIFTVVATRYHFLTHGQPRCVQKLPLQRSLVKPSWSRYHGISPWQKYLQFEDKRAPFHYPDSLWTYNDGLLVFPSATEQKYVLYDLVEGKIDDIPFDSEGKVVRRMRLKDDVLLIEWCEAEPYHMLNESEEVHRHFATAYDLVFDGDSRRWSTTFRNEWKIHFLGMPLNSRDRFFSSHSRSHYALYLWQPNRSAWGEDEPIEALAVWDISSPSMYRPSTDSTGQAKPDESAEGARVVRRLSFSDLDFYGIRQRSTPCFRGLAIDEKQVYFTEEDHRWIDGDQSGAVLPRIHKVKTTSIPFHVGPMRQDECGADGDVNMSFCQRETELREPWMAPCWRHEEFPYLTITECIDAAAGLRFCARHCFMFETLSINIKPKVEITGSDARGGMQVFLKDDLWTQLLGTSKYHIAGDERWLIGENEANEVVVLFFDRASPASRKHTPVRELE